MNDRSEGDTMNRQPDEFDDAKEKGFQITVATDVLNLLRQVRNTPPEFQARWIWELHQNAHDAALSEGVKVDVMAEPEAVTFRHSGRPFTPDEIFHLVYHGSSKGRDPNDFGRFGSGFLSTHVVSDAVRAGGLLDGEREFDFLLDHSGSNADELLNRMNSSFARFRQSIRLRGGSAEYTTSYHYKFGPEAKKAVSEGVNDLLDHAPYVLALNGRFQEIRVNIAGRTRWFRKEPGRDVSPPTRAEDATAAAQPVGPQSVRLLPIRTESDPERPAEPVRFVAVAEADGVFVAVLLRRDDSGRALSIEPCQGLAHVFLAFPLLDTRDFCFPAVVHSRLFEPNPERVGIRASAH